MFITIYWPVWIDAFCENEIQKGLWMTLILVASICAYVVGYALILVADMIGMWEIAFYVCVVGAVPFIIWIAFIPNSYLDPMLAPAKPDETH